MSMSRRMRKVVPVLRVALLVATVLLILVGLWRAQTPRAAASASAGQAQGAPQAAQGRAQQGFDMSAYYRKNARKSDAAFLRSFPYGQYLQRVEFTDFKTLQQHRKFLYHRKGIGDEFLYHLADTFIKLYPVRMSHLDNFIAIGEAYVDPKNKHFHSNDYVNKRISEIYRVIGYYLLGRVAGKLRVEIAQGRWNPDTPAHQAVLDRLKKNRTYVPITQGTWEKIWENIEKGKWGYLASRGWGKMRNLAGDYLPGVSDGQQNAQGASVQPLALKGYKHYYQLPGSGGFAQHIYELRKKGNRIGYSVWLRRPSAEAHYIAHGAGTSVTQRYKKWKAQTHSRVMVTMTGGFTNAHLQPEGLTVEDGNVVNAVIMPDRDGLVIVGAGGGMRVANLEEGFKLPRSGKKTTRTLNPAESLLDYSTLMSWCKEQDATVFQTQLLAHGDKLLIDPRKADDELRERRILVLARSQSGTLYHVAFDVPKPHALAHIAALIFETIEVRGMKVEAMLNLDVGSHNIMRTFDDRGRLLSKPRGPVGLSKATNLIVYTR